MHFSQLEKQGFARIISGKSCAIVATAGLFTVASLGINPAFAMGHKGKGNLQPQTYHKDDAQRSIADLSVNLVSQEEYFGHVVTTIEAELPNILSGTYTFNLSGEHSGVNINSDVMAEFPRGGQDCFRVSYQRSDGSQVGATLDFDLLKAFGYNCWKKDFVVRISYAVDYSNAAPDPRLDFTYGHRNFFGGSFVKTKTFSGSDIQLPQVDDVEQDPDESIADLSVNFVTEKEDSGLRISAIVAELPDVPTGTYKFNLSGKQSGLNIHSDIIADFPQGGRDCYDVSYQRSDGSQIGATLKVKPLSQLPADCGNEGKVVRLGYAIDYTNAKPDPQLDFSYEHITERYEVVATSHVFSGSDLLLPEDRNDTIEGRLVSLVTRREDSGYYITDVEAQLPDVLTGTYEFKLSGKRSGVAIHSDIIADFPQGGHDCFDLSYQRYDGSEIGATLKVKPLSQLPADCGNEGKVVRINYAIDYANAKPDPQLDFTYKHTTLKGDVDTQKSYTFSGSDLKLSKDKTVKDLSVTLVSEDKESGHVVTSIEAQLPDVLTGTYEFKLSGKRSGLAINSDIIANFPQGGHDCFDLSYQRSDGSEIGATLKVKPLSQLPADCGNEGKVVRLGYAIDYTNAKPDPQLDFTYKHTSPNGDVLTADHTFDAGASL